MTTSPPHLSHPKYRADIDGLRAVAVLAVVGFHAFPVWMKGGFIGVDIFFVISGYLISTIIFENLDKGTFSFSEFYARRIKRIFPALLLVLVASYAFGWTALLSEEFKQLGKHILAGAGFASNYVLWSEAGYFDNSAETKPLLHLWSLGIEEQFYIVWPLVLYFAWKRKFNLLTLALLFAAVSFALNVKNVSTESVAAFYSPQTRFWELLCGSMLAWLALYRRHAFEHLVSRADDWLVKVIYREPVTADGTTLSNCLSILGSLLLLYGFWTINKAVAFPGMWAVVPVVGAVLIISAGPDAWINRKWLSNKWVVWFGLISFPLYLWHWPMLSFARILESEMPSREIRIAAVALSVVLAWLTYRLVERPMRFGAHGKVKVAVLLALMAAVGFVGYQTYSRDGLNFRHVTKINTSIKSGADGGPGRHLVNECGIKDEAIRKLFAICATDKRGGVRFALMGDSKAGSLYSGLVRTSSESGRWLVIGGAGAHGAPIPMLVTDPDPNRPLTNHAIDAISNNPAIEAVVVAIATRAVFYLNDGVKNGNFATYDYKYLNTLGASKRFDDAFAEMNLVIRRFIKKGQKVVLIVDNPPLPNPQDCINRRTSLEWVNAVLGRVNPDCSVPLSVYNGQIEPYRRLLAKLEAANAGALTIFDPTDIYCDTTTGLCNATRDGRLMYSYTDHISDYASGLVGQKLNEYLSKQ